MKLGASGAESVHPMRRWCSLYFENLMDSLGILDLVIGLFFIYFVLSVICTAVVEGIAQLWEWRSSHLNNWITDTFDGPLGHKLLQHGLIKGLTQNGRKADYIPANIFITALLDIIYQEARQTDPNAAGSYDFSRMVLALRASVLVPEDIKRFLLQALEESQNHGGSLALLQIQLKNWYEAAMERLIGTYKKRARFFTWLVAFFVTFFANADTIALSKYLKDNPQTVGANLVQAAMQATKDSVLYHQSAAQLKVIAAKLENGVTPAKVDSLQIDSVLLQLRKSKIQSDSLYRSLLDLGLPLGWENAGSNLICDHTACSCSWFWCTAGRITRKCFGLLLTTLALTLGAPFWFDMINKLVNIRSAGNKPEDDSKNPKNSPVG